MRALVLSVIFLCAVSANRGRGQRTEVPEIPEPFYAVANAVNSFGARVLLEYRVTHANTSIIFSPLSMASAFYYLYKGAGGSTRTELEALFGFGDEEVDSGLEAKQNEFTDDYSALLANRIYVDDTIDVKESYINSIGSKNIRPVDFLNEAETARLEINSWVDEKTSGLIPKLLEEGVLSQDTLMVIVNALYFKGFWEKTFPKEDTYDDIFHGIHGDEEVPFMVLKDFNMVYKEMPELNGVMAALPYRDDGFLMYIFLPNTKRGWKNAEWTYASYAGSIFDTGYERQMIDTFRLPKWEMESSIEGLEDILSTLGISTTFSTYADFTNITTENQLSISDVVHKAKIVVDEEGTEAAASTAIVSARSAVSSPAINVTIDRPFLYFIVSRSDRTVLFQGTQTSVYRT